MEWFRVYHGTCQNPKLHKASRLAGVSRALVIAVWIAVLEKASKAEERGDLSGLDPDEVAFVTGVKPKTASAIIAAMIDVDLIVDGRPKGWDDRQPAGDDAAARKRAQRERLAPSKKSGSEPNRHETEPNVTSKPFRAEMPCAISLENNVSAGNCHGTVTPRTEQNRTDRRSPLPPTFGGGDPVQRVGSDETPDAGPPVTAPIPPEPSAAPPAASLVRQASAPEPAILPLLGDQQAQPKPARQKRQAAAPNDLPALTMCPWKTPEDIPRDLHEYARTRGLKPDSVALDFINYWLNRAKNPTNRDWRMVWQTWCRREAKDIDLSPKKVKYAAGTDFL